jgi:hypothetical protein
MVKMDVEKFSREKSIAITEVANFYFEIIFFLFLFDS